MPKQNQKPKNKKKNNKNKKPKKNDKTQLSATTPPLGVCSLVFFLGGSWFFGCLFSSSLLFFFLQWPTRPKTEKTRNQNNTKPKKTEKYQKTKLYIYTSHYL